MRSRIQSKLNPEGLNPGKLSDHKQFTTNFM